jgi:tryptophan 2,3-dioxygenase
VHGLDRINEILKLLIQQLEVLETMTPLDFLDFAISCFRPSAFQSAQFRMIEIRLGLSRDARSNYAGKPFDATLDDADQARVGAAERGPEADRPARPVAVAHALRAPARLRFLARISQRGAAHARGRRGARARERAMSPEQREAKRNGSKARCRNSGDLRAALRPSPWRMSRAAVQAALFIIVYRDRPVLQLPFRLLAALMNVDELLTLWRYRHALMVQRMIGVKIGTGGSAGHDYLRDTAASHRIFSDLFRLSTYLIPRSRLPKLPREVEGAMGYKYTAGAERVTLDLREHFSEFRGADPARIHLAAHSHHFWPDAACRGHRRALEDAARLADRKWETVFGVLMPRVQRGIAAVLALPDPATIASGAQHPRLRPPPALGAARGRGAAHSYQRQRILFVRAPDRAPGRRWTCPPSSASPPNRSPAFRNVLHPPRVAAATISSMSARSSSIRPQPAGRSTISPARFGDNDALVVFDGYHGFMAVPTALTVSAVARSISPAATSMRWRAKASASCIARRALPCGRATPAGSPPSARSEARATAPSPTVLMAPASWARRSIRPGSTGRPPCSTGWTRSD